MKRRRVTMADVARKAGVTQAAVSYALAGRPGVSKELRARILRIADELGFRRNRVAVDLRQGRTGSVGLLLADIANPFYPEVASGVIAACEARGYEVFVSHVGLSGERQVEAALSHVDRNVAGLLFTSLTPGDRELLDRLDHLGIPFVQLHRWVDEVPADWVGIDNFVAAKALADHVMHSLVERVAIIGGPNDSMVSRDRTRGYLASVVACKGKVVNPRAMTGMLTRTSGRLRARRLLSRDTRVEAFLCGNDVIALGVLDACRESGVAVPRDVLVAGFDDMSFASAGPLQLTTVEVPRAQIGQRGAVLLLDRIEGATDPPSRITLRHRVRIRETTSR